VESSAKPLKGLPGYVKAGGKLCPSLLGHIVRRPVGLHIVLALERLAAHITLVRLVVAVALDVLAEVLGLVELGPAQVTLVALQQLLVALLVQLEVELALKHLGADDAGMISGALTQARVQVALHVLLLDESLLALGALEHLAEGEGDVGGAVPLRLVVGRPRL